MWYEYSLSVLLLVIIIVGNWLFYSMYDFLFVLDWVEKYYIKLIDDRLSIVIFIMIYICFCYIFNRKSYWLLLNWYYVISYFSGRNIEFIRNSQHLVENNINLLLYKVISGIKMWSSDLLNKLVYFTLISLISIIICILLN